MPFQFRVLVGNLIGFGWVIFLTNKRRKLQNKLDAAERTKIVINDNDTESTSATKKKSRGGKDKWADE